jgi:uncharacterized protein YggE
MEDTAMTSIQRNITVKGVGKVSANPDQIALTMSLEIQERDYADTMNRSAVVLDALRTAITSVGHDGKSLKTTSFNIDTRYESYKDKRDTWQRRFEGYICKHGLILEFDLDMKLLVATLAAIAECDANPEFSIRFSVKDGNAVSEQFLVSAVENATAKARVLANYADSSSGWLTDTTDGCTTKIAEICRETPKDSEDADYIFMHGLKDVLNNSFDGWEDFCYDLLRSIAPLTTEKRKPKILEIIDKLNDKTGNRSAYTESNLTIQYEIILATESREKAWDFLQKHLEYDDIIEIAIKHSTADGKFDIAEKICVDRFNSEKHNVYSPIKWAYMLNDIYTAAGNKDGQISAAELLFFMGKYDNYKTVKKLHIEKGDWEQEKGRILAEAEDELPESEYVKILNIEGDNGCILEMAKSNPFHIIKYGKKLIKDYPEEVIELFRQAINEQADFSKTRTHYRYLAKHIKALSDCGRTKLALKIIDELIAEYPRRFAMHEELNSMKYKLMR